MKKNLSVSETFLGKQVNYPQKYSPKLLRSVARCENREIYGIDPNNLPFSGIDVWHVYEFSFLTNNGLPVAGVLKMILPADSVYFVESKAFKLYLNSFNMERFGNTVAEGISIVLETINKDIVNFLNCNIKLSFFNTQSNNSLFDFSDYQILENNDHIEKIEFTNFNESPDLLLSGKLHSGEFKVATHLLRSNCKITNQPDWGSAFIYMKGARLPSETGLLQYLVSIRNENHFHEEVCEMIYQRLYTLFSPDKLMVAIIYTRRGGIDICPIRVNDIELLPKHLSDINQLSYKLLRQ
jgi:7-cyano-7-deazaguanine reductase